MARKYRPRATHALPITVDGDLLGYVTIDIVGHRARYATPKDVAFLSAVQAEAVARHLNFTGGPGVGYCTFRLKPAKKEKA